MEIKIWRDNFQSRVKKLAGNEYLQLTCEVRMPNASPSINKQDILLDIETNTFPYLDIELFRNSEVELELQVHRKTNQKPKYPNKGSTHTNTAFNATPSGIFNRLAKIM